MAAAPAHAEEPVVGVLTCDAVAELSSPSGSKLVVHDPGPEQRRRLAAARPWRFGPFDVRVYGFEWVLFFLDEPAPRDDPRYRRGDLLVRLEGPRSPWLRMVGPDLRPNLPQLIVGAEGDGRNGVVRFATPDPAVPLFLVQATSDDQRSEVSLQYLIDFLPSSPSSWARPSWLRRLAGTWTRSARSTPLRCSPVRQV